MRKIGIIMGILLIMGMFLPPVTAYIHNVDCKHLFYHKGGERFIGVKIDDRHWYTLIASPDGGFCNSGYLAEDLNHNGKRGFDDFDDRDYYQLYSKAEGGTLDGSGVDGLLLVQIEKYLTETDGIHTYLQLGVETMFADEYYEGLHGSYPTHNWIGGANDDDFAVEIHIKKLRVNGDISGTTFRYSQIYFPPNSHDNPQYGNNLTAGEQSNENPVEKYEIDMIKDGASFIPVVGTTMTVYDMASKTYRFFNPPQPYYRNSIFGDDNEAYFKWMPKPTDPYHGLFATSINTVWWEINNVKSSYDESMGIEIYAKFHYTDYKPYHSGWGSINWRYVERTIVTPPVYIYMITRGPNYNYNKLGNVGMPFKPLLDTSSTYTGDGIHATVKTIDWEIGDHIYNGTYGTNTLKYNIDWGDGASSTVEGKSGQPVTASHSYNNSGIYYVRVQAMQNDDITIKSPWSPSGKIVVYSSSSGGGGGGSPPSGGGACPFLFTYNGTWRAENNLLLWAENATRYTLTTRDYYLFNAIEKDGVIRIGIGESGEDVDYIDSVKLYKVRAPIGYKIVESYSGRVYAYKNVEIPSMVRDNRGNNVKTTLEREDGHYWIGDRGDFIDVKLNLSKKNLLLIRGIDNPPQKYKYNTNVAPSACNSFNHLGVYKYE